MPHILIIEDDISIGEIQRDFLLIEGYDVTIETDGQAGHDLALRGDFHLIILDVMLPSLNGYDICRSLRGQLDIPIIMVTAKGDDMDKIRGLGLGADDYVAKPFSPTELVARVKANLAQYQRLKASTPVAMATATHSEVMSDLLRINTATHRVYLGAEEIPLKNKEYELLLFLAQNPDIVFSKEHLYERIWGMDAFGDLKTVAVHINRIRDKIEKDPQNPVYLQTVWGAGYRFKG